MIIDTPSMHIVRAPNGLITVTPQEGWNAPETVEVARENVAALLQATKEPHCALLMYIPSTYLKREIVREYVDSIGQPLAIALVSSSFASRIVGTLVLKVVDLLSKKEAPTKLFREAKEAEDWLLEYLAVPKEQAV